MTVIPVDFLCVVYFCFCQIFRYWYPPRRLLQMRPQLRAIPSNFLYCDCNALWMRDWLRKINKRIKTLITCSGPVKLKGRNITNVPKSEFVCGMSLSLYTNHLLTSLIIV